jgi:bifunctional DNase/RNase
MFGIPSIKREGQTMLNICMEQCEGVYLMNEIEQLRKENQRQKEHIMLLNAMIQTEHNIIRVVDLKEGE